MKSEKTETGVAFASLSAPPGTPAPTLLLFAGSGTDTLRIEPYCRVGHLLHAHGWNIVSLDLPCHGADRRAGEPEELAGWAARIRQGEDIVATFQLQVNEVVNHLIATGRADPARIAAAGTSRGGFMAFQSAIANPAISAVAAFGPVTDLSALSEFAVQADNPLVQRLALIQAVDQLADRAVWMMIGKTDERVDTRKAVAFGDALGAASQRLNQGCDITLRLMETPGHASLSSWHDEAAQWFLETVVSTVNLLPGPGHPLSVSCRCFPPHVPGNRQGLVIHLYGSGGSHSIYNLMRPSYRQLRRRLREAGYWVVVPNLGPTHWMNPRAEAIMDAVIATLIQRGAVDPRRVHLLGCSMGASSALIYAGRHPDAIRSVCAVFPATDFVQWFGENPAYRGPVVTAHGCDTAHVTDNLRSISPLHCKDAFSGIPILLLHGDADQVIPVHHSRDFAAVLRAAGCPVVYYETPGAGHDDQIAMERQETIFDFIQSSDK